MKVNGKMNIYEFMFQKEKNVIKFTFPELTVTALIKAFNTAEINHDKISQIQMHEYQFNTLKEKMENNKLDNNIYKNIIETNSLLGASIIINNNLQKEIVILKGSKKQQNNIIKLFIGKL